MKAETRERIEALAEMTVAELREKYADVFGEPTRSRHKRFLQKRITWGLQAREEGGLSERAKRRAAELARDTDLRLLAPRTEVHVLIVIDVGDSPLAPHQAREKGIYYYRAGGHSKPAPHFYVETLRNRLAKPVLRPELLGIQVNGGGVGGNEVSVNLDLNFRIHNEGRVAAYKWALAMDDMSGHREDRASRPTGGIRIDETILPTLAMDETKGLKLTLRPVKLDRGAIRRELVYMIPESLMLPVRVVAEASAGEVHEIRPAAAADFSGLADAVMQQILGQR